MTQQLTRNIFHTLPSLCNHKNSDLQLCTPSKLVSTTHTEPSREQSGGCLKLWPHQEDLRLLFKLWLEIKIVVWVFGELNHALLMFHSTAFTSVCINKNLKFTWVKTLEFTLV